MTGVWVCALLLAIIVMPSVTSGSLTFWEDVFKWFARRRRRGLKEQLEVDKVQIRRCGWRDAPVYTVTLNEHDGAKLPKSEHMICMN